MGAAPGKGGYFLEFHRVGNAVKVSACDPDSLVEVSIVGDARTPEFMLERIAIRKLERALGRGPKVRVRETRGIVV